MEGILSLPMELAQPLVPVRIDWSGTVFVKLRDDRSYEQIHTVRQSSRSSPIHIEVLSRVEQNEEDTKLRGTYVGRGGDNSSNSKERASNILSCHVGDTGNHGESACEGHGVERGRTREKRTQSFDLTECGLIYATRAPPFCMRRTRENALLRCERLENQDPMYCLAVAAPSPLLIQRS